MLTLVTRELYERYEHLEPCLRPHPCTSPSLTQLVSFQDAAVVEPPGPLAAEAGKHTQSLGAASSANGPTHYTAKLSFL